MKGADEARKPRAPRRSITVHRAQDLAFDAMFIAICEANIRHGIVLSAADSERLRASANRLDNFARGWL